MMNKSLHEIEHQAWSERASFYDDLFASTSTQAIAPILEGLGDLQGKKLLDVACGTGHLVAAAANCGASSQGVDFAPLMIDAARANYPDNVFQVAEAAQLPYGDSSFDAVACSFGLSHMEYPQAVVNEVFRVLKAGGRFAFTLWFGADDGGEFQSIGQDAIATYATISFMLPTSWTQLRYADEGACENILEQAGFNSPQFKRLPIVLQATNAQAVLDIVDKLSIRTKMILDNQTQTTQKLIHKHILSQAEARRVNGVISIRWPALLTVVEKPE